MKTSSPTEIAAQIAEITLTKGTAFAGFDYNGKHRNVTIGAKLINHFTPSETGRKNWGESFAHATLVAHSGKMYIQCLENMHGEGNEVKHQIKRFELAKVSNFTIG